MGVALGGVSVVSLTLWLMPPAPVPIGGVVYASAGAMRPSSMSADEAEAAFRKAFDRAAAPLALSDEQRASALEQVAPILVAHTHGLFERYYGLVSSWGARPREHMTAEHLDALRRAWVRVVWQSVDLEHAKVWIAPRNDEGRLVLTTPDPVTGGSAPSGVYTESVFRYPTDLKSLAAAGATVLGVAIPARLTSGHGDDQLVEVRLFFIWSAADGRWLPYGAACDSAQPPPAVPI